ncbi:hypothetical protein K7432_013752 [Basidiobolus ranarum]|uniref:Uncharacterized protein n=1 Tax=Basidiobolus ranarum TaxID=34480 RepID=A0ABR2WIP8_9FUNG
MSTQNIWLAASDGNLEEVKGFLEAGISVDAKDQNGYTPLHAAVSYGHTELVQFLLDSGANVNITDSDGDTPLHVCENFEVAEQLVKAGADIQLQDDEGKTAIDTAEEEGHYDVMIFLQEYPNNVTTLPLPEEAKEELAKKLQPVDVDGTAFMEKATEVLRQADLQGLDRDAELQKLVTEMVLNQLSNGASYENDD